MSLSLRAVAFRLRGDERATALPFFKVVNFPLDLATLDCAFDEARDWVPFFLGNRDDDEDKEDDGNVFASFTEAPGRS